MSNSNLNLIKEIRSETGLPIKDISKALNELGNSASKDSVLEFLRKQGTFKQASRSDRVVANGSIFSYVHEGRIGVLVELKCETDFVARSESFKTLGNDLSLHIAAYQPKFTSPEEVDTSFLEKELEIEKEILLKEGKPENIISKILEGKRKKITEIHSLLTQPFLKNTELTVKEYIAQVVQTTGENIQVGRFYILSLNS